MPVRRIAAAYVCALLLALPGAALAQGGGGAGDQQYTDPFGSQQATPTATAAPRAAPTAAPTTAAPAATATAAPTGPAPATTAAPAAAPAAATSRQLPYTGAPVGIVGAAGLLLLGGGLALRARLRDRR